MKHADVDYRPAKQGSVCVCVCVCAHSDPTLCDPRDCGSQAPLSMGFHKQEYWSGLPFPSPGGLYDPRIKPMSPVLQADSLLLSHQGS